MSALRKPIAGETWRSLLGTVLGTWFLVWVYAAVHDQVLIRIHHEHFTVWHYKMPFIENHTLLALAYAFFASITPGLVLGVALYVAGRLFDRPKTPVRTLLLTTFWIWLGMEAVAIPAGLVAWQTGRGLYPDWLYPDYSKGLQITQTVQITAYLTGSILSLLALALVWRSRGKRNQA